ncbi:hypothetical protein DSCO28_54140 [Desulfosarcina ovata subsp. sediminis]|uniref:Phasin domain-containing protein n=1 Tax=Desulfosarcina ovata subsp. sediminis TaxID=885957 RepID=A0A5K7ZX94_9BACT|nr:hypothetical protein [Desulfosarcina ovata]BBO84848.1 hypothetical protein DSCO28_54140 [Desulfosarcina ovata subsp. sediminis]
MNFNQIAKQAVDFQKIAFSNWYKAVTIIQDQAASAMETMVSQADLPMPEEARNAINNWVNTCQEEFERFHSYVESGFSGLEKHLVQETKSVPAKSPNPAAEEKKPAK